HRDASPLPLLNHIGVGLLDQLSDVGERLAPPIIELLDPGIDQPRGGLSIFRFCHLGSLSFPVRSRSSIPTELTLAGGGSRVVDYSMLRRGADRQWGSRENTAFRRGCGSTISVEILET